MNHNTEEEIHKLCERHNLHFQIIHKYNRFYITLEDKPSFRIHPCVCLRTNLSLPPCQGLGVTHRARLAPANEGSIPNEGCAASRQSRGQGSIYHWTQNVGRECFFLCCMNSNIYFLASAQRIFMTVFTWGSLEVCHTPVEYSTFIKLLHLLN